MDKILKISAALVLVVVLGCVAVFFTGIPGASAGVLSAGNPPPAGNLTVYFFYGEECPHCHTVMPLVINLSQKYPNVEFHILEIWHNQKNYDLYSRMNNELKNSRNGVPVAFVGTTIVYGGWEIPQYLEPVIVENLKKKN
jgi:thiol-disulfide isomerase/thioredoxin